MVKTNEIKHLPDVFKIKEGAKEFPLMVVVSVTYVCNAKCPNCPYTQSSIRKSYKDMPFMKSDTFKKIADECGQYHSYIRLTGGGEPLLHPQMLELIEYAKNVGAKIGLITNGSKLESKVADRLLNCGTDVIEISADAADKETYAKVRTGLNFKQLLKNVFYLVNQRNKLNSKTKIIASVINQKAVEGQLEDIVKSWKSVVDEVQVRKYLTWGIGDPDKSADKTPYIPDLPKRVPCPFPFERLNIDSRGKIEFCGYDIAGETNFGNVNEVTIKNVWQGERFNEWRQLLLDGKYEEIPICKKCPDWKYRSWNYNYWNVLDKAKKARIR